MSAPDHTMDANEHAQEHVHPHVAPWQLYAGIFGILIFMTIVTVAIANFDLGAMNTAVAVVIATIKASLVVTFFMHLKDDSRFNALFFLGSLLFGGLFLVYTLNDTAHRGAIDPQNGTRIDMSRPGQPGESGGGEWAAGTSPEKRQGRIVYDPKAHPVEHH